VKKRDVLPAETGWSMLGPRPPLARSWWKIAGSRTCEKIRVETKQVGVERPWERSSILERRMAEAWSMGGLETTRGKLGR
jgi:hypothetical protein